MSSSGGIRSSAALTPRILTPSCHHQGASRFTICPAAPGIRVDSHVYQNYVVPQYYDSMVGKLIAYAPPREQAIARDEDRPFRNVIEGIKTNVPLHQDLMRDAAFGPGGTSIHYLEHKLAVAKAKPQ